MENKIEEVLNEALTSIEGKKLDTIQENINHFTPYHEKVKDSIPNFDDFLAMVIERSKNNAKNLGYDLDKIIPVIKVAFDDLMKVNADDIDITPEFINEFLKPYYEKVNEYCPNFDDFIHIAKHYHKSVNMQPKNDLMSVIKECNAHFRDLANKAKENGTDNFNIEHEELVKIFKPYHDRVIGECPELGVFMELCGLDLQYGFIGGGMMNTEGATTIKVD